MTDTKLTSNTDQSTFLTDFHFTYCKHSVHPNPSTSVPTAITIVGDRLPGERSGQQNWCICSLVQRSSMAVTCSSVSWEYGAANPNDSRVSITYYNHIIISNSSPVPEFTYLLQLYFPLHKFSHLLFF